MPSQSAAIWAAASGAAVVVVGAVTLYIAHPSFLWPAPVPVAISESAPPQPRPEQPKAQTVAPATEPLATAPVPAAVKPAFDVVNVEPTGETVVAGRAAPNAKVELRDAGKTVAEATANSQGQFVIIPPALQPGSHSLTLAAPAEPAAQTSNAIEVAVAAPEPKSDAAEPTPAKAAPSAPSSASLPAPPPAETPAGP